MNFKRKKYMFLGVGMIILISSWAVLRNPDRCKNANVPSGFVCYNLGTDISFEQEGNSRDFVKNSDGWGGQESKYRCAVGKNSVINLYIPKGQGKNLQVDIEAFGVFGPNTRYQTVEVYANETNIGKCNMNEKYKYSVVVPSSVMTNDTLTIRFHGLKPYTPKGDTRKISMAVSSIKITKVWGYETSQNIARWLYRQFDATFSETEEEKKARQEEWKKWTMEESEF